jgi:hypothetical protein
MSTRKLPIVIIAVLGEFRMFRGTADTLDYPFRVTENSLFGT